MSSYHVEIDSDTNNSPSTNSDMWGSIDSYSERSQHQSSPHAYIATVIGPTLKGISNLLGVASVIDLGDSIDDFPLLNVAKPSSVVMRAPSNPLVHSLHDQSS